MSKGRSCVHTSFAYMNQADLDIASGKALLAASAQPKYAQTKCFFENS